LTTAEGRRFAWTLAAAFAVLGALLWWRHRATPAIVAASLSLLMLLAGAFVPSRLGPVQRAWMGLAHAISRVTTPIFLAIVYFLVLTPAGFMRRTVGGNPLVRDAKAGSFWVERDRLSQDRKRQRLERQF
jgi:hypothetical protein